MNDKMKIELLADKIVDEILDNLWDYPMIQTR